MRKLLLPLSLISCLLFADAMAQITTTAVPFLRIAPSTVINSMGRSGVALDYNDPFLALDNPAYMPTFSTTSFSAFSMTHSDWLPNLTGDLKIQNYAVSSALNLESLTGFPLKAQLTYVHRNLDMGESISTDQFGNELARFTSNERTNGIFASVSYKYWAEWSIGAGYDKIYSSLSPIKDPETQLDGISEGHAWSFGFLSRLPLHEWFTPIDPASDFNQEYYLNLGASVVNSGDKLIYSDPLVADPLPKTGKIGYSTVYKLNYRNNYQPINLFLAQWSVDVSDLLITNNKDFTQDYDNFPGDISILNHVIGLKAEDKIQLHKGYMLSFFESFTFMQGWDDQVGFSSTVATTGLELSSGGLFKYLAGEIEMPLVKTILAGSAIKFSISEIDMKEKGHPLDNTKYSGFSANFGFTF